MTHETMQSHAKAFSAFGMTYDDLTAYQKWIAENAPKRAIQAEPQASSRVKSRRVAVNT
jgi:hypothetical protein